MKEKVFIFVALPYANGPLHLGHIAGAYLPYDAFRRFMILTGREVISASGSDEHGTPITIKAMQEGISPKEIATKFHNVNSDIFKRMNIEFNAFIETSSDLHKMVVKDFITKLIDKGYIYEGNMVQPFCPHDNMFLPDRYVKGKCPKCGYENARGDQCENCGATLEPSELINPVCILDGYTPEFRETKHLFFKLSSFQEDMEKFISERKYWRDNVLKYSRNFISQGLKDRPITRDLEWGVDIPFPGYESKKIYVWFEALIGYITGTVQALNDYNGALELWKDRKIRHYYFMGKDNIPFHSIIWPAMLMAEGEYTLPYYVAANEYLNFQGEKFSKSGGVGISMPKLLEIYNSEYIRFGVFYNLPEGHDSDFSLEEFQNKVNSELIDKFGNFVNRALILSFKKGKINRDQIAQSQRDIEAEKFMRDSLKSIIGNMENVNIREAFKVWLELARYSNIYITERKPWEACKKDDANCLASIYTSMKIVFTLAVSGQIFLPETSKKLLSWLGYNEPVELREDIDYPVAHVLQKPEKLFEKITSKSLNISLKVAQVMDVMDHPNAEKLYLLDLNLGEEKRRIISGIKDSYTKEALLNKKIVIVSNLKPAVIRGEKSNGMLLAAEEDGVVHLVLAPEDTKPGSEIGIGDYNITNEEISIEEFKKHEIMTYEKDGDIIPALHYNDSFIPLTINGKNLRIDGKVSKGIRIK